MEAIPTEILDIIFQQFSSLNDIRKCFVICLRWRKIIENMFQNSKFLINAIDYCTLR